MCVALLGDVYLCVCVCFRGGMYLYACVDGGVYLCMSLLGWHLCVRLYVMVCICAGVFQGWCAFVCVCVCVCVCVFMVVWVCVCIFIEWYVSVCLP